MGEPRLHAHWQLRVPEAATSEQITFSWAQTSVKKCWFFLRWCMSNSESGGAVLTLPELQINLTFLKLHFEGNESIMCTKAPASWGKTIRKGEVERVLAPSLPLQYSLCIAGQGERRWARAGGVCRPPEAAAKFSGSRCCPSLPEGPVQWQVRRASGRGGKMKK